MLLEQLGNLGAFIGSIGVVVTLVYLTIQLRQNTSAIRSNTLLEIQRDVRDILKLDSSTAVLLTQARLGKKMPPAGRLQLVQRYAGIFRTFESIWFQWDQGCLDSTLLDGYMHHLRVILYSPIAKGLWDEFQGKALHPGFISYVDGYLKTNPPVPHSQEEFLYDD